MARIRIIVGTVYGTAQFVAEELRDALDGHHVQIVEQARGETLVSDIDILIVCTATTGTGDLPDTMQALYQDLQSTPRALTELEFAVVALGDSSYLDSYCGAGETMQACLMDLGAKPLAPEPLRIDAALTMTPEEEAVPWVTQLVQGK